MQICAKVNSYREKLLRAISILNLSVSIIGLLLKLVDESLEVS